MPSRVTCPECQTLLAIPDHLVGRVVRCPRCKAPLPGAGGGGAARSSGAITDRPAAPDLDEPAQEASPFERDIALPEARVQLACESCGETATFSPEFMGMVAECPACGEGIDVPDLTTVRYERQLRETDRQLEQTQRQLDCRDLLDRRAGEMIERAGRLLTRWEALVDRLDRVLNRQEQQGRRDEA